MTIIRVLVIPFDFFPALSQRGLGVTHQEVGGWNPDHLQERFPTPPWYVTMVRGRMYVERETFVTIRPFRYTQTHVMGVSEKIYLVNDMTDHGPMSRTRYTPRVHVSISPYSTVKGLRTHSDFVCFETRLDFSFWQTVKKDEYNSHSNM